MFVNSEALGAFFLILFASGALLSIAALALGIWLFNKIRRQLAARQLRFPGLIAAGAVICLEALLALALFKAF